MTANRNRQLVLRSRPKGAPGPDNFELRETAMPEPAEGEVLVRGIWLTVDPYMRGRLREGASYAAPQKIGEVMTGEVVGEVVRSRSPRLAAGDFVAADIGWQEYGTACASDVRKLDPAEAPISTALHVLGMTGLTAYFGLFDICRPRAGDTVVVSAASGAVGGVVGQLAKIAGCRAVGTVGSDEKARYILGELGYDAAIDYRTARDLSAELAKACPDGIDCYFDNVGGPVSDAAFESLAFGARVAICGQISQYNDTRQAMGPRNLRHFLVRRASLRGFLVFDFRDRYAEGRARLARWLAEGALKYREDISDGLEAAPDALAGLMEGRNFGKKLVRLAEDPTRAQS